MNKILSILGITTLSLVLASSSYAAVSSENLVRFEQGDIINVAAGQTFTLDLIGENFLTEPDGAGFKLSWDPTVLSYVNFSVSNPATFPWDASYSVNDTNASSGLIDFVFLSVSAVGQTAGSGFALGSFTFNAIGAQGAASGIQISDYDNVTGFVAGVTPIAVNYVTSNVQVVPIPSAVWLFGSGMMALLGVRRRNSFA